MPKKKVVPASLYALIPEFVDDDALTARWIVRRPNTSSRSHLCGYRIEEETQGCLVRDQYEAEELGRAYGWKVEPFGEEVKDGKTVSRKPFAPTPEEISAMPVELRPYDWLLRQANNLKHDAAEVSGHPTRSELLGFVRDKGEVLRVGIKTNLDPNDKPVQTAEAYQGVQGG
jgi:hypothetical protein